MRWTASVESPNELSVPQVTLEVEGRFWGLLLHCGPGGVSMGKREVPPKGCKGGGQGRGC